MSPRPHTHELVFQAAYRLLREGIRPSVDKIRAEIGTGSSKTINDALHAFWWEAGQRLNRPDLPGPLAEACQIFWQQALEYAEQNFTAARQALEAQVAAAESEKSAALMHQQQLAATVEALQSQVQQLVDGRSGLEQQLAAESARRETLSQQLSVAQQAVNAAESRLLEAGEDFKKRLAEAQQRYSASEQQLIAQRDELTQRCQAMENTLSQREQSFTTRIASLEAELAEQRRQVEQQSAVQETLRQERDSLSKSQHRWETRQEQLRNANEELTKQRHTLQAQVARLTSYQQEAQEQAHLAELAKARAEAEQALLQRQLEDLMARLMTPKKAK